LKNKGIDLFKASSVCLAIKAEQPQFLILPNRSGPDRTEGF